MFSSPSTELKEDQLLEFVLTTKNIMPVSQTWYIHTESIISGRRRRVSVLLLSRSSFIAIKGDDAVSFVGCVSMIHSSRFICSFSTSFFCRRTRKWTQRLIFSSRSRTREERQEREKNYQQSWEEGERATASKKNCSKNRYSFFLLMFFPPRITFARMNRLKLRLLLHHRLHHDVSWHLLPWFHSLLSFLLWISLMSYSCHTCHPPSFSNFSFSGNDVHDWSCMTQKRWEGREIEEGMSRRTNVPIKVFSSLILMWILSHICMKVLRDEKPG